MAVREYTVNLQDGVSAAASRAAGAVRGLAGAMGGLQAAAMGVAGVMGAVTLGIAGLVGYAINAADKVQNLQEAFGALAGGGPEAGKKLLSGIRDIARELPQSRAEVTGWARELAATGMTDLGQLRASLHAIAGAEALLPGGAEAARRALVNLNEASERGTKFKFNIKQLAGMGLTEGEFLKQLGMTPSNFEAAKKAGTLTGQQVAVAITDALNAKAQGPLSRAMKNIGTRIQKGWDEFSAGAFGSLNLDKLGQEVTNFFGLFASGSSDANGQIKSGIGAAVQWLTDKLADGLVFVRHRILDAEVLALELYIFFRKAFHGIAADIDWSRAHWDALVAVVVGAATGIATAVTVAMLPAIVAMLPAIVAATTAFAASIPVALAAAGAWLLAVAPFALIAVGVAAVVAALVYFWPQIQAAGLAVWEFAKTAGAAIANFAAMAWNGAVDFVAGLVAGIVNGTSRVVDAVKNMGKEAWDSLRSFWGAHSPAELTKGLGRNIAEGQVIGLESQQSRVAAATQETLGGGTSPASASPAQARAPAATGGGGSNVTIRNEFNIMVKGGSDATARELYQMIEEEAFVSFNERMALSQGVAPVPA